MVHEKNKKTVVFVTFESEFSKVGGLGAVIGLLPRYMLQDKKQVPCFVLAPFFPGIISLADLKKHGQILHDKHLFSLTFAISGDIYSVQITEVHGVSGVITYFIASDSFFKATHSIYVNPCNLSEPLDPYRNPVVPEKLTEDALFFSAAVPHVLVELHRMQKIKTPQVVLHLQDWETAAVVKALQVWPTAPQIQSVKCVLTMHNPYDRAMTELDSVRILALRRALHLHEGTVLEQCLPDMAGPISTVSKNFARELTTESLHTRVFAPHLQRVIVDKGMAGIENGLFGAASWPFSPRAWKAAQKGNYQQILKEKQQRRKQLALDMKGYQARSKKEYPSVKAAEKAGVEFWGTPLDLSDNALPVFMIMGRDDPRQKGFDVIVEAIRMLPENQGRFIFTINPGDEGLVGLDFLKKLTADRPGEVIALPYQLKTDIFAAIRKGSSYMVMGSLYEPFGAVTEACIAGMPMVARATGGLVQQIVPYPCPDHVLSLYGSSLAGRFHQASAVPTGILFREKWLSEQAQYEGWRRIVDCSYWKENPKGDRIADRKGSLLFDEMVKSAASGLQLAIDIYTSKPEDYGSMIYHGYLNLKKFDWGKVVRDYNQYLY